MSKRTRPTDRSGKDFRYLLTKLPQGKLLRQPTEPIPTKILWVPEYYDFRDAAIRSATAWAGGLKLFVVEMRPEFIETQPIEAPRISWGLFDDDEAYGIGGAAPTFEDAKSRAELAVRVQLGADLDS